MSTNLSSLEFKPVTIICGMSCCIKPTIAESYLKSLSETDIVHLEPVRDMPVKFKNISALNAQLGEMGLSNLPNYKHISFGLSQILAILEAGNSIETGQTFFVEQPEIGLDARMQACIADFLLKLVEADKNVIIETHSDHVINRIVRRALEYPNEELLNRVAVYFVDNGGTESKVHEIKIDRVNGITDCPAGFFDQYTSETSMIFQAGIRNMKMNGIQHEAEHNLSKLTL